VRRPSGAALALRAVLLLAAGSAPGLAQAPGLERLSSDVLYERGVQLLESGAGADAIAHLALAVAKRPDELRYAAVLARAYLSAGREAEAKSLLETLRRSHPDDALLIEAQAHLDAAGKHWEAVDAGLAPIEERLSPDGALRWAEALAALGRSGEAVSALRRAVARNPREERLWLAVVDGALDRKQDALALRWVGEAAKHGCDGPAFQLRAAQAYLDQGATLGPVRVIRVPDGKAGQFVPAGLLVERQARAGEFLCAPAESALFQIRAALDRGLDTPEAHVLHARVWLAAGRPHAALGALRTQRQGLLSAADEPILRAYVETCLAAGALPDAVRALRSYERLGPKADADFLRRAFLQVAERYNQRGEDGLFREFLRRAVELAPDDMAACLRLGDALWDADRKTEAQTWYRRVVQQRPLNPQLERVLERLAE
jgi:tetratricopeptide (TPR) repeat protein